MLVPLSQPYLDDAEIDAVTEVIRSTRLSFGPQVAAFEQLFAEMLGSKYAIAVSSGTAGLHLAVRALGLKAGDEVITTPFSFIASANCLLFEGVKPVFVDVEEESFNLNPANIEAAITPNTKAILPVHVFGQSADMTAIMDIAQRYDLHVIEDACESILARHHGQVAGTFGDIAVYGFYPNKQMTTGEGGMILTDREDLYQLCKSMRNQGRGDSLQWLSHTRLGYNYRISDLTAALGVVQTKKLPEIMEKRAAAAERYHKLLQGIKGIHIPMIHPANVHSWFVYSVRVAAEVRDTLIERLNTRGVQSKAYFYPCIHLQEFYQKDFGYQTDDYPIAEQISHEVLILPFFTQITEAQQQYVVEVLREELAQLKAG